MKRLIGLLIVVSSYSCAPTGDEMPPPAVGEPSDHGQLGPAGNMGASLEGRFATPPASVPTRDSRHPESSSQPAAEGDKGGFARGGPSPSADSGSRIGDAAPPRAAEAERSPSPASASGKGGGALAESVRSTLRPIPEERPGLGTSWGETRYSSVREVPFERDSSYPVYTSSLYYNDERGACSLAGTSCYATTAVVGLSSALTVSLRDEYGRVLPAYRGSGRTVAVGTDGQRYSILVHNNTNERFEVVLSVDGLDVLDGRAAGYGKRGYLIEAYGTLEVEGYRQSEQAVASFRFGKVSESYAAQTGSARNVGVIGAAAYGERGYQARLQAYLSRVEAERLAGREIARRLDADPFPNKYASPPLQLAR